MIDLFLVSKAELKTFDSAFFFENLPSHTQTEWNRITSQNRKQDWLWGRSLLYKVYKEHLRQPEKSLELRWGDHGKPFFKDLFPFNLSHSKNWIGVALLKDQNGKIGLDLQSPKKNLSFTNIGKRYFTESENATLQNMPQNSKENFFYQTWTFKEAYSKALGLGLHKDLQKISRKELSDFPKWSSISFHLDDDYGSIVIQTKSPCLPDEVHSYLWNLDSNSFKAWPMKLEIFEERKEDE